MAAGRKGCGRLDTDIRRENASATARQSLTAIGRMKETANFMVTYAWRGNCVRRRNVAILRDLAVKFYEPNATYNTLPWP